MSHMNILQNEQLIQNVLYQLWNRTYLIDPFIHLKNSLIIKYLDEMKLMICKNSLLVCWFNKFVNQLFIV